MDKLQAEGRSFDGYDKTMRIEVVEGEVLIDTEGRGDSGVLFTENKAKMIGEFLKEVDT